MDAEGRSPWSKNCEAFRKTQIVEAVERLLQRVAGENGDYVRYGSAFEQITVKAICDEAGISRPTFYHHFKDKFEIAQWFWDLAGERYLKECGRTLDWYESNLGMLRSFKEHAVFYAAVNTGDKDLNACINHGYRRRVMYLEDVIRDFSAAFCRRALLPLFHLRVLRQVLLPRISLRGSPFALHGACLVV